ncbi:prolipoprotein diacylglyceryl transferase [Pedobacter heparinus]|uniref:Prolipoprotein diacylglyceryl transferase n=1 Tax=Pedobacter heparinus (strain ATCC 13125 / DSM 2366 / CIP 104194 / JCM 7457 / NBRC 12017 / NCIMB 9290 / NRRL B-14731 / HIM 762-3) TaxID=485917 RepID=C6Y1Z2_PEDHD|nr:prolipoprotein diacylglyceryl transferase family protein [Pedobacter heparinus]ACU05134.1 prolipoprotein diacylglyceryl transferase [Pedobacter heparinus DSM 2366]
MFPTVSHFIEYLFGIQVPLPFNTFGVFVALAFIAGYWAFTKEFKRKEALGILHAVKKTITIGKPASTIELASNAVFGFLIGYKLVYALLNYRLFVSDAQTVLLSMKGNILGGLCFAGLFAWWDYHEKNKAKLPKPKTVEVTQHPYELMGNLIVWAAVWGFLGAKIFDNLEHWNTFVQDPINSLLSFSGLTFYGGLICGGAAVLYIARKNGIKPLHMLDIGGPGMMLAYSVGRIGCHMSGDGDWGVVNVNPKPFGWLPDWLWAYTYPNNVANEGERIAGCVGKFCNELPLPVYPTPIYEVVVCFILFLFLWRIRHRIKLPGMMFGIYLMLNGLERFFIELIRVNTKYEVAGLRFTQAEMISSMLFIAGLLLVTYSVRNKEKLANY